MVNKIVTRKPRPVQCVFAFLDPLLSRAGDLAAAVLSENALIATDLLDFLPDAFASLEN